MLTTDGIN